MSISDHTIILRENYSLFNVYRNSSDLKFFLNVFHLQVLLWFYHLLEICNSAAKARWFLAFGSIFCKNNQVHPNFKQCSNGSNPFIKCSSSQLGGSQISFCLILKQNIPTQRHHQVHPGLKCLFLWQETTLVSAAIWQSPWL